MAAIADVTWALQRMPPQARGGRSCMVKRAEPISCDRSAPNQSASQPLPPQAARDRRPSPHTDMLASLAHARRAH